MHVCDFLYIRAFWLARSVSISGAVVQQSAPPLRPMVIYWNTVRAEEARSLEWQTLLGQHACTDGLQTRTLQNDCPVAASLLWNKETHRHRGPWLARYRDRGNHLPGWRWQRRPPPAVTLTGARRSAAHSWAPLCRSAVCPRRQTHLQCKHILRYSYTSDAITCLVSFDAAPTITVPLTAHERVLIADPAAVSVRQSSSDRTLLLAIYLSGKRTFSQRMPVAHGIMAGCSARRLLQALVLVSLTRHTAA